ncbi:hypothetical protein Tco_1134583 [Tanacetum coccineum]
MYGKIWYDEDVHDLRSVETEFPAIVFNDALTSEVALSCETMVSPLNNNQINFRISFNKSDKEDYKGLEVGSIRRIQGIGYDVLEFLGVGTTFDIFQNIHILYLQYGVLTSSGYGVLIFFPLWSLVSAGTDTPYLP